MDTHKTDAELEEYKRTQGNYLWDEGEKFYAEKNKRERESKEKDGH